MDQANNKVKVNLKQQTPPHRRRWKILFELEEILEIPMVVLGFVWLVLLVVDLTRGLNTFLEIMGTIIWVIFVVDYLIKFTLAPQKLVYIKNNLLTTLALFIPALRVFRFFRAFRLLQVARASRGVSLVRIVSSLNRGMKALGRAMGKRGFGYVAILTVIVVFAGAAGMFVFERDSPGGLDNYWVSVWWTAMLITTMGSEFWPKTQEGRFLCLLLAIYAFAIFGYIAATLASIFVENDSQDANLLNEQIKSLNKKMDFLLDKKKNENC